MIGLGNPVKRAGPETYHESLHPPIRRTSLPMIVSDFDCNLIDQT